MPRVRKDAIDRRRHDDPPGKKADIPGARTQLKAVLGGYAEQMAALRPSPSEGGALQCRGGEAATASIHDTAAAGVAGTGSELPHLDRIQQSFGGHDISHVQAHVGGAAAIASDAMGAMAYATGNDVAFRSSPDLFTAAHEAAHVVQQRAGVSLRGGVGQAGDPYERHADEVAEAVVAGRSAEQLLGPVGASGQGDAVQHKLTSSTSRQARQIWNRIVSTSSDLELFDAAANVFLEITIEDADTGRRGQTRVTTTSSGKLFVQVQLYVNEEDTLDEVTETLLHEVLLHAYPAWDRFDDAVEAGEDLEDLFDPEEIDVEEAAEHLDTSRWAAMLGAAKRTSERVFYHALMECMDHIKDHPDVGTKGTRAEKLFSWVCQSFEALDKRGLDALSGTSGYSGSAKKGAVDVFKVNGTRYAANDPRIRSGGECFWDTMRHYGFGNGDLQAAADTAGAAYDGHVYEDQVWPIIQALAARTGQNYRLVLDRFTIAGASLGQTARGGDGPVLHVGFMVAPDAQGHYVPRYG